MMHSLHAYAVKPILKDIKISIKLQKLTINVMASLCPMVDKHDEASPPVDKTW